MINSFNVKIIEHTSIDPRKQSLEVLQVVITISLVFLGQNYHIFRL